MLSSSPFGGQAAAAGASCRRLDLASPEAKRVVREEAQLLGPQSFLSPEAHPGRRATGMPLVATAQRALSPVHSQLGDGLGRAGRSATCNKGDPGAVCCCRQDGQATEGGRPGVQQRQARAGGGPRCRGGGAPGGRALLRQPARHAAQQAHAPQPPRPQALRAQQSWPLRCVAHGPPRAACARVNGTLTRAARSTPGGQDM